MKILYISTAILYISTAINIYFSWLNREIDKYAELNQLARTGLILALILLTVAQDDCSQILLMLFISFLNMFLVVRTRRDD